MQLKTVHDVGAFIRDRRTRLGWTQGALAVRVGVSRLWIVQLEKGKATAQIGLVLRTLKELGSVLDASIPPIGGSANVSASAGGGVVDLSKIIQRAGRARK
jgi:HTH-type transcriptional regulator/antitoxin HipB